MPRRPSGKVHPNNSLTHLWERHHEIKRRLVLGQQYKDIAKALGMSTSRISDIANSAMMKDAVIRLREKADSEVATVEKRLNDLKGPAVEALREVLSREVENGNTALRVKVAIDVLDRTGHGKHVNIGGDTHVTLEQYVQNTLTQINGVANEDTPDEIATFDEDKKG